MNFSFTEPGLYRAFWDSWSLKVAWGGSLRWCGLRATQSSDAESGLTLAAALWWVSVYVTLNRARSPEWIVGAWFDDQHLSAQAYRGDDEMNAMPWMFEWPWKRWVHVRCDTIKLPGEYPYRYELASGEVQEVTATLAIAEREWRWMFRANPFRIAVRRYVDVTFSDEVGEGRGSWKGGTIGCAVEMRPGDDAVGALRRMERERRFT